MAFVKADSTNLPVMENIMILEYMASSDCHNLVEIRGAKALLSSRTSYLETAVGFVEVCRTQQQCTVNAQVAPEHKVRVKNYKVSAVLDEKNKVIVSSACDDCAASAGGCKHSLVLLYWLEKKFAEPATTEVKCYWAKPKLKDSLEPISIKEVYKNNKNVVLKRKDPEILNNYLNECKKRNCNGSLIYMHSSLNQKISFNLYDIAVDFMCDEKDYSYINFFNYSNKLFNTKTIEEIQKLTVLQSQSKFWHSIRQCRITGSKIYEASVCKTDGVLVQQILGGYKVPETQAIRRGKSLEKVVMTQLAENLGVNFEDSGIMLINSLIGASPDGISTDLALEIKCPSSENTFQNYIRNGEIKEKFMAQIQLQMFAAKKKKGVFCIADPKFESNKKLHIYWVDFDEAKVNSLINQALNFWKLMIYPKILASAQT